MVYDPIEDLKDLITKSEAGDDVAQCDLAEIYKHSNGQIVPRDYIKAVYWFEKSAMQDNPFAQANLGFAYANGEGVTKDNSKAIFWYEKVLSNPYADDALKNQVNRNLNAVKNRGSSSSNSNNKSSGCYVATCVYGTYDCPEVWTLRRFRDNTLAPSWVGKQFIRLYYFVSPSIVSVFGNMKWFNRMFKVIINKLVKKLVMGGITSEPYTDI